MLCAHFPSHCSPPKDPEKERDSKPWRRHHRRVGETVLSLLWCVQKAGKYATIHLHSPMDPISCSVKPLLDKHVGKGPRKGMFQMRWCFQTDRVVCSRNAPPLGSSLRRERRRRKERNQPTIPDATDNRMLCQAGSRHDSAHADAALQPVQQAGCHLWMP